jgi:hypothetical protein
VPPIWKPFSLAGSISPIRRLPQEDTHRRDVIHQVWARTASTAASLQLATARVFPRPSMGSPSEESPFVNQAPACRPLRLDNPPRTTVQSRLPAVAQQRAFTHRRGAQRVSRQRSHCIEPQTRPARSPVARRGGSLRPAATRSDCPPCVPPSAVDLPPRPAELISLPAQAPFYRFMAPPRPLPRS